MIGLDGNTKMKKRESQSKFDSRLYNIQINHDVNHRGLKLRRNNKLFPPLNVINKNNLPI